MENPRIVFIGTPEFGAIILKRLIESSYEPVLVITTPDKPVGRKQILTPPPVKEVAENYNLKVMQPEKIGTVKEDLANLNPDLIITAAYGQIIPKEILNTPKYGSLNVHPSLLPKYRGASPIQTAILNGDEETGVTIMLMDEKMDHGPILLQKEFKVNPKISFKELHDELARIGADLLMEVIPERIKGEIEAKEQDHSKATFTKVIKKEDGEIDWNKSPDEIERQVRAFYAWPSAFTFHEKDGKLLRVKILEAEVSNGQLVIRKVQPEGKKEMSYEDFLKGNKNIKFKSL